MVLACQLEAPKEFLVKSIECTLFGQTGILGISSRWYAESLVQFDVGHKVYYEAPLSKCASLAALLAGAKVVSAANRAELDDDQLRRLKKDFTQRFDHPVLIEGFRIFRVEFTFSDWQDGDFGLFPDRLLVVLNGDLIRPTI